MASVYSPRSSCEDDLWETASWTARRGGWLASHGLGAWGLGRSCGGAVCLAPGSAAWPRGIATCADAGIDAGPGLRGGGPRNRVLHPFAFHGWPRASPSRLETKHASDVALETLTPCGAISPCRPSGHSTSAGPTSMPAPARRRHVAARAAANGARSGGAHRVRVVDPGRMAAMASARNRAGGSARWPRQLRHCEVARSGSCQRKRTEDAISSGHAQARAPRSDKLRGAQAGEPGNQPHDPVRASPGVTCRYPASPEIPRFHPD